MPSKDIAIHVSIGALSTFVVSWLDIRPLGILCLGALVIWAYSIFCPCSYTLDNGKPLQDILRGNMEMFAQFRRDKPAAFCLIVSVALLLLMILGHIVSGTWLVIGGLSVVGLISSRHSIRIVKAPQQAAAGSKLNESLLRGANITTTTATANASSKDTSSIGSPVSEVDEFLPEVNESAMQVLNLAGDEAILFSAKTSTRGGGAAGDDDDNDDDDSVPMEMLMPEESLPDVEKDHLTDDNISEDEFRLHPPAATSKAAARKRAGGGGVVESSNVITTSDEDEESLAKGLNFDDFSDVDASQRPLMAQSSSRTGGGAPKELTGLVTEFVSNMIPWNKVGSLMTGGGGGDNQMSKSESTAVGKRHRRSQKQQPSFDSSDDSEFELLNSDELKNYEA